MKILLFFLYITYVASQAPTIHNTSVPVLQPTKEPTVFVDYKKEQSIDITLVIILQVSTLAFFGLVGSYMKSNYLELRKVF